MKSEVTCHKTWRRFQTRIQTEQLEHHIKFSTGYPIFRFPHKNDVRLIRIYPHLLTGGLMSFYLICVWLHIVVTNTYCVVFLVSFCSSSSVPYVASFLDYVASFLDYVANFLDYVASFLDYVASFLDCLWLLLRYSLSFIRMCFDLSDYSCAIMLLFSSIVSISYLSLA